MVRSAVEEQKERVDKTTEDIGAVVIEMRSSETKTRDEMREIRDEVTTIREMLPKVFSSLLCATQHSNCIEDDGQVQGDTDTILG